MELSELRANATASHRVTQASPRAGARLGHSVSTDFRKQGDNL
jgi:hypothetical protein